MQALYRLNPIVADDSSFDVIDDYPRSEVEDYSQDIESGRRQPATVVTATFELEEPELGDIREEYGDGILEAPEVVLSRGYPTEQGGACPLAIRVPISEAGECQQV